MKMKTWRKSQSAGGLKRLKKGAFSTSPLALAFSNSGDSGSIRLI